jgi:hypothetical protein
LNGCMSVLSLFETDKRHTRSQAYVSIRQLT